MGLGVENSEPNEANTRSTVFAGLTIVPGKGVGKTSVFTWRKE
jgi:hypothetical protein